MGNKVARPAETPYIVADAVGMDVKPSSIVELKVKLAGGTEALKSALTGMARQNFWRGWCADKGRKAQNEALMVELENGQESDIARHVAYHESRQEL